MYVKKDIPMESAYKHPYFVDSVIDEAIEVLSTKKKISEDEAEKSYLWRRTQNLYNNG